MTLASKRQNIKIKSLTTLLLYLATGILILTFSRVSSVSSSAFLILVVTSEEREL